MFSMGMPYLINLLEQNDFIVLQEHWPRDSNMGKLSSISNSFDSVCKSAMEFVATCEILVGRPFGETAVFEEKPS